MSKKAQNTVHIHRKLPRNPYIKLHKRLVDFSNNAELDPELMLRNEYLRLENMILRGMYFEERERLKFSEEEKIEMAKIDSSVRPYSAKDSWGYVFGDMAGSFVNLFVDAYFLTFCTYALGINAA